MSISDSVSRLTSYYQRHGFKSTLQRGKVFVSRLFSSNRLVVYSCDLSKAESASSSRVWPDSISFTRITCQDQIEKQDWVQIVNFWDPKLSQRNFSTRFREGASVWFIRSNGKLAGFGWTMTGRTMKPYFFPLGPSDVHLFDFLVFPEFRGKGINPLLVTHILEHLEKEHRTRAFIEAAEWNHAQLNSLAKTGFQMLGVARTRKILGRRFVEWDAVPVSPASGRSPVAAKPRSL
jgi:ribosomal protein S18 acetylase RimI-like enzyme